MSPKRLLLAMGAGAIAIVCLNAQPPAATVQPVSYVVSIKRNNAADARGFSEYSAGGRLTATAITVRSLLRIACRVQDYQLVGAPAWLSTRRYDIAAKADENPSPSQQTLLRALLKDRFKLVTHNETRELPVFALTAARSDGRPGPQLVRSAFDCAAYLAGPHEAPQPGRTPNCATNIGAGRLSGKAITMLQLATSLAPFAGRLTVDKTGLTRGFDVELRWTPERIRSNDAGDTAADTTGPSIFTALQEQLGLKLVSERGPVDVFVIDNIEEPTEN